MRAVRGVLTSLLVALAGGCVTPGPPLPAGLVDMSSASPGQTALAAQGGVGGFLDDSLVAYGGGGLAVEPRATPRLSVPIGVGAGAEAGASSAVVSTRVGLRYRFLDKLALGGGFDSSHSFSANSLGEFYGAGFDLELGGGARLGPSRRLMISGMVRPAMLFGPGTGLINPGYSVYVLGDLSLGYEVIDHFWLTAHLWGGSLTTGSWGTSPGTLGLLSGGIGLRYVFGERGDQSRRKTSMR